MSATADVCVRKNSRVTHLNSGKHKDAVRKLDSELQSSESRRPPTNELLAGSVPAPRAPAPLSIVERLALIEDNEPHPQGYPSLESNPFDEVARYGDELYDNNGAEVRISAGIMPTDQSRARLLEQIKGLEFYEATSAFGKMMFSAPPNSLEDEVDDLTRPTIGEAIRAMGKISVATSYIPWS